MIIPDHVVQATTERFEARTGTRSRTERCIGAVKEGRASVLEIDSPERVELRLRRVESQLGPGGEAPAEAPRLLERIIEGNNLLAIAFLELGTQVARTVGRVHVRDQFRRNGFGTGFMVAPRVLMTNNHVLEDVASTRFSQVEFGYQNCVDGRPGAAHTFDLRPDELFLTDRDLDVTVVAVSPRSRANGGDDAVDLAEFGFNRLSGQQGKVVLGESINIIQHPEGEPKQLALQQNELVDRLETFLHYRGDTSPGSSGSPLFNNQWEVLGLHHSGVPARDGDGRILAVDGQVWTSEMGEDKVRWIANEGVRISSVLAWLEGQEAHLDPAGLALAQQITTAAPPIPDPPVEAAAPQVRPAPTPLERAPAPAGNEVSVTLPITISVRLGGPQI